MAERLCHLVAKIKSIKRKKMDNYYNQVVCAGDSATVPVSKPVDTGTQHAIERERESERERERERERTAH